MINILESFSGIGAQTAALKKANINHQVLNTIEWEIGALFAYDILHNGPQNIKMYRHHTKDSLVEKISNLNISNDGKNKMTYRAISGMSMKQLKSILYAVERSNNLIDIQTVKAESLPDNLDLFTYSFPCQDLSISSFLWNNDKGINRDSGGQSSLLWEVERILYEYKENNKPFPKFLLMENVSTILSSRHIKNFRSWTDFLNEIGYYNKIYNLNASHFSIPQNRKRTYMISIFTDGDEVLENSLDSYFKENNLEDVNNIHQSKEKLKDYLRLDYSIKKYKEEAILATPQNTPSRRKIFNDNVKLAIDDEVIPGEIARTITTKQDRNPNSGIIVYDKYKLVPGRDYRNLTPREAFLLMGYNEEDFELLIENNFEVTKNRMMLSDTKLLKLAGNSIVVDVLSEIFLQIEDIKNKVLIKNDYK